MVWHGRDALLDEINNLESLVRVAPSNFIRLYEKYTGPERCYLVLEKLENTQHILAFLSDDTKDLHSELEAREAFRSIASVVAVMHRKQIAHRNLKPTNIVIMVRPVELHHSITIIHGLTIAHNFHLHYMTAQPTSLQSQNNRIRVF